MLKILHITGTLDRGGIEVLLNNIVNSMNDSNVKFDFLTHRKNGHLVKSLSEQGSNIYVFEKKKIFNLLRYVFFIKKIINEEKYDIVHSHLNQKSGLILLIFWFFGIKYRISHCHIAAMDGNLKNKIIKFISGIFLKFTPTHYMTCSVNAGIWMFGKKNIKNKGMLLLQNGIISQNFIFNDMNREKIRKEYNLSDKLVLGHVGRFDYQKNHSFLLELIKKLVEINFTNFKLVLLGDGPKREDITSFIVNKGLEDYVVLMGNIPNVNEFLSSFDLMLLPSHFEGLPLTLIEAQFNGLPIIASNKITEEVDLNFSLINFEPLDINNWVSRILTPIPRKLISKNQINDSKYDISYSSQKLINFYREILEK